MAIAEDRDLGAQIVADAKRYVLHSWSVQDAIEPIAVAGGEGRYFWDHDGKRYLDFASQLINLSLGHGHPKLIAATTFGCWWPIETLISCDAKSR